jgi:hypothetical protein
MTSICYICTEIFALLLRRLGNTANSNYLFWSIGALIRKSDAAIMFREFIYPRNDEMGKQVHFVLLGYHSKAKPIRFTAHPLCLHERCYVQRIRYATLHVSETKRSNIGPAPKETVSWQ